MEGKDLRQRLRVLTPGPPPTPPQELLPSRCGVGQQPEGHFPQPAGLGQPLGGHLPQFLTFFNSSPPSLPCPLTSFVGFTSLTPLFSHPSLSATLYLHPLVLPSQMLSPHHIPYSSHGSYPLTSHPSPPQPPQPSLPSFFPHPSPPSPLTCSHQLPFSPCTLGPP